MLDLRSIVSTRGVQPKDIPACKLFFRCLETSGKSFADSGPNGVVITPSDFTASLNAGVIPEANTILFHPELNAVEPEIQGEGGPYGLSVPAGSFPNLKASDSVLLLVAGRTLTFAEADILYPDTVVGIHTPVGMNSVSMSTVGAAHGVIAGVGATELVVVALDSTGTLNLSWNTDYLMSLRYEPNVSLRYKATGMDTGTSGWELSAVPPTATTITNDQMTRFRGLKLYGLAMFVFSSSTLPADIDIAEAWMGHSWRKGRTYRGLYAPWAGLA